MFAAVEILGFSASAHQVIRRNFAGFVVGRVSPEVA
jgi:hypothetical protein